MLKKLLVFSLFCIASFVTGVPAVARQFIRTDGHRFMAGKKPYYYIGANYWYAGLLALQKDPVKGKERLRRELDFLRSNGVNNLRVLVGSEGSGMVNGVERVKPTLQPAQGKFDPALLAGIDYLLYEMAKRKMVAILYLSNNWEWSGGFLQYLNWNGVIDQPTMQKKMDWDELRDQTSKFYSCSPCKQDYQNQVRFILEHVNPYTKRAYKNEPAIMAWELANEPRPMRPAANEAYLEWAASAASFIKSIDVNHLVTLGTEGIMGTESSALFKEAHAPAQIDYLTLHIWPKNWGWFSDTSIVVGLPSVIAKTREYIRSHEQIALELNKPLVIEEFGLPRDAHVYDPASSTRSRDQFYSDIFNQWKKSKDGNGAIAGCNFWSFSGTFRPKPGQLFWKDGDEFSGDPPQEEQGLNSVFDRDTSTWNLVRWFTGTRSR